jgi:uncharacterized phage-associated protein
LESYSIKVIANWFLHKESMSNKKLQKLCYYAEAWHQALYDSTLIKGSHFEAWVHGPVCPSLYEKYKDYGWNDIPKLKKKPTIDQETNEFLEIVYNTYGHFTGHQLETLTHNEKPWQEAREGLGECEASNNVIKTAIMKEFYNSIREETQND